MKYYTYRNQHRGSWHEAHVPPLPTCSSLSRLLFVASCALVLVWSWLCAWRWRCLILILFWRGMAMQMACTLRGLSSPLLRESNGEISSSHSAILIVSLCSSLIKNGISSSSSCQLLQSSRIFILQVVRPRISECKGVLVGVRCEQSTEGNKNLDIWLGHSESRSKRKSLVCLRFICFLFIFPSDL